MLRGIPDIVETDHTHIYKTPQYEAKGSIAKVSEEGIAATSNTELKDGLIQAASSQPKKKDYNMVSMVSKFVRRYRKTTSYECSERLY